MYDACILWRRASPSFEHVVLGFVCAHLLGYLTAAERRATFSRLAGLPTAGGVGVVTLPRPPPAARDEVIESPATVACLLPTGPCW